jgi:transposase-like protein
MAKTTFLQLADRLRTEAHAYEVLEQMHWGDQPVCPHCGSVRKHYFLKPSNGSSRKTRTGSASERRVWKCADCRKQFSATTNTIFHGSKIPLRTWLLVVYDACSVKNGISAREVERKYDLTAKSAWFMMRRLREAMKREPVAALLSGRVIVDETWYGGKPSNRHGHKRAKKYAHLHTDSGMHHQSLAEPFAAHSTVDHKAGEYVRQDVTTNHAEGYFSQLKRSLDGDVPPRIPRAPRPPSGGVRLRYSTCKLSDTERIELLVST